MGNGEWGMGGKRIRGLGVARFARDGRAARGAGDVVLQLREPLAGGGGETGGEFERGVGAGVAGAAREELESRDGGGAEAVFQLRGEQIFGFRKLIRAAPDTVALELGPTAEGPVLRGGWVRAADERGGAIPEDGVRGGPARALAGAATIGEAQVVAVHGHVVEERAAGPALDGPAVARGLRGLALHEGVRAGGAVADGEVVPPALGPAAEEERLLTGGEEGVAATAGVLGDGREREAVLHGHARGALEERDGGTGEVREGDLTDPRIAGVLHRDGKPGMVLVLRVLRVVGGFEAEVFDADVFHAAGPRVSRDGAAAELGFEGGGDGRVERDAVAGDGGDGAVPVEVACAGSPGEPPVAVAPAEVGHAEAGNPFLRAGAGDEEAGAGGEADAGGVP